MGEKQTTPDETLEEVKRLRDENRILRRDVSNQHRVFTVLKAAGIVSEDNLNAAWRLVEDGPGDV